MRKAYTNPSLMAVGAALAVSALLVSAPVVGAQSGSGSDSPASQSSTTALDPCQLVTADEASALAGTTFTKGVEQTTDGGSRICVYGYQTTNVFMVLVAQSADATTAQATWSDYQARAQNLVQNNLPPGVNVNLNASDTTNLQGFDRAADGSASASLAGRTINLSAIYLLKGVTFVSFSDMVLTQPAPTTDGLEGEAATVQTRLP
jgi:hypothetical protein